MNKKTVDLMKIRQGNALMRLATAVFFFTMASLVGMTDAKAVPLNVTGFVNPTLGVATDNGDGTTTFSQVDYRFDVLEGSMNGLTLNFESDVFVVSSLSTPTSDFSLEIVGNGKDLVWAELSTPLPLLVAGQSLEFSLLNLTLFTNALTDPSLWSESQGGGIWEQPWSASFLTISPFAFGSDGGSTAPVPEPASLILMGSGLAGLGLWRMKRSKKA